MKKLTDPRALTNPSHPAFAARQLGNRVPRLSLLALAGALLSAPTARATAIASTATGGAWSDAATWSPAQVPVADDTVTITTGATVTVDSASAACASLQIGTASGQATLTFAAAGDPKLTVSGAVAVGNSGSSNRQGTVTFTAGSTLHCGSLALGTATNQMSTITMTAGGTLSVGGAITRSSSTAVWTPGTGTVELRANNTLPTALFTTFNNLTINGGTTTLAANVSVTGDLAVAAGSLDLATFTANRASAGGTFTLANGASLLLRGSNFPTTYTTLSIGPSSTVNYNNSGAQSVAAQAYGNLIFSGSNTKSMVAGTSVAGNLSIAPTGSAKASVGAGLSLNVGSLTLAGTPVVGGSWGGSGSAAANIHATYFAATTGQLLVATGAATRLIVTLPGQTFTSGSGNSGTVSGQIAGTPFEITLTAVDAFNNVDAAYTETLNVSYSGPTNAPSGASPNYTNTVTFEHGQVTGVAVALVKVESTTLTASSAGLTGVASSSLAITAGAAAQLAFTTQPGGGVAATAWPTQPVVTVQDTNGNTVTTNTSTVTVGILNDAGPGATLTGTLTKAAVAGVANFSANALKIDRVGTGYTLTATAGSLASATSNPFNITTGTASKLAYSAVPSTGIAGTAFSVTVQTQDAGGNPANVTSATTITLSKATGGGTLSGALSGIIASGTSSIEIATPVYSKSDTMTLTAARTAGMSGLTPVTSGNIVFSAGTATKLAYTAVPATGTAGTAFSVTLQSQDANGNPANVTVDTTIALSKATGAGTLSGTLAGILANESSSITLATPVYSKSDTMTLIAAVSDGMPLAQVTSGNIVFSAGAAAQLAFTTQPSGGTGGTAWTTQPVVTVQDANGNTVTTNTSTVTLAILNDAGPGATLSGTLTKAAVAGVANFSASALKIDRIGTGYTLAATGGSLASATSSEFNITTGTAAKLAYTAVPATGTAGTPFSVTVQTQDAGGNPANVASATTITLSKATGGGTLSGALTGIIALGTNSIAISTPVYSKSDTMTLTATRSGLTPVTSGNIVFSAGLATKLAYTSVPTTGTAGTAFSVTLQSQDAYGNPANVTGDTTITLSKTVGAGTLSGTLAGIIGNESNELTLEALVYSKSDTMKLTATALDGTPLTAMTSGNIVFSAGAATRLAFTTQPSGGTGGTVWTTQPVVTVQDANGNTVTTPTSPVTVAILNDAGPGATLSGILTNTVASGVASFSNNDLTIDLIGEGYTLIATNGVLASATSSPFNVTTGTAKKLAYTAVPASGTAGTPFSVTVQTQDLGGNPANVTSATVIALSKATGGGTLSGTLTGTIASGANNVTIATPVYSMADTMTLAASRSSGMTGLTAVTSGSIVFAIGAVDASHSTISPTTASITANGVSTQLVTVQARDANHNNYATGGETVEFALSGSGNITGTTDHGNGTYTATVTSPSTVGTGTVTATLGGAAVGSAVAASSSVIRYTLDIGTATSTTAGTSIEVTTSAVNENNTVIVSIAMDPGGPTPTVSDARGNTYTKDADVANGTGTSGVRTLIFSAPVTTALIANDLITVTFSSAVVSKMVSASYVSGLMVASRVDKTATATGAGIAPSSGSTDTTTQPDEVLFGAIGVQTTATAAAFTAGSGYTPLAAANVDSTAGLGIYPEYMMVNSTGTYAANGSLAASRTWAAAVVAYKMLSGVAASHSTLSPLTATLTADGTSTQVITVQARDANDNLISTGGEAVTIALTSGAGSISTTTDNGDGTYAATLTAPTVSGSGTVTATINGDLVGTSVAAAATVVTYAPGPLAQFAISPIASPQTVGTAITGITLTALDANGNQVPGFIGTVTFGGTAGVTGTSTAFDSGMLSGVSVMPMAAGSDLTVTVTDGAGHNGSATIATLDKAPTTITTPPTATSIVYGQTLASSTLSGGEASVPGSFSFTTPSTGPVVGTAAHSVTFTPADADNYQTATTSVNVTVAKASASITTAPTATAIVYGQSLASSTLSGGEASVPGSFAFTAPATAPAAGTALQSVTFTPADMQNYQESTTSVSVTVAKVLPMVTWSNPADIVVGTPLSATQLNANSGGVDGGFVYTPPSGTVLAVGTNQTLSAQFTPTDTDNYESPEAKTVTINVMSLYSAWIATYPGLTGAKAAADADPDGDGHKNLMEYAFGTNPAIASSDPIAYGATTVSAPGQPTTSTTNLPPNGVDFRVVFGRRCDWLAAGLTYTVQFSADLSQWVASTDTPSPLATDSTIDAVSVPYPSFIPTNRGAEKPQFFRLGISSSN